MFRSSLAFCALASLAVLGACHDKNLNEVSAVATVKFINATDNAITLAQNGSVVAGGSGILFGQGSTCLTVVTTNPALTFTGLNGTVITGFVPSFVAGGRFTIVAFTDANGNTQFATLDNSFVPVTGQAGVEAFNAAVGSGNVVLLSNGNVLNGGATTAFGTAGTFFSQSSGSQTLSFNNGAGTQELANTGAVNLLPNTNNTIVLAPAAAGTAALRAFVATGC